MADFSQLTFIFLRVYASLVYLLFIHRLLYLLLSVSNRSDKSTRKIAKRDGESRGTNEVVRVNY